MREQMHSTFTIGRDYEVEHRTSGGVQKTEGELIDLDESGFVVLEKNGKRILIRKDLVEIMREKE